MKNNQTVVGIDVSKSSLDIFIFNNGSREHLKIDNCVKAIQKFIDTLPSSSIVAMENTGRYNWYLYEVLAQFSLSVYVLNPLHLKKSMGLIRGKNDKIDASRIATYIAKNFDSHSKWMPPSKSIKTLQLLISERKQRVNSIQKLKAINKEYGFVKTLGLSADLTKMNNEQINLLRIQIKAIEQQIKDLLSADESLNEQLKLIKSVPGVGNILAWHLIAKTQGFSTIKDPRKLACYAGVVPFSNQSGVFKGKQRVSSYADKSLKSLLHLGAMSAIRLDNDLAAYYKRKVNEGKNKMSVINAVRNKMIHRVYAVLKNKNVYQNHLVMS